MEDLDLGFDYEDERNSLDIFDGHIINHNFQDFDSKSELNEPEPKTKFLDNQMDVENLEYFVRKD